MPHWSEFQDAGEEGHRDFPWHSRPAQRRYTVLADVTPRLILRSLPVFIDMPIG